MMSIMLYSSFIVEFFDFDSLMTKFIITLFYDDSDDI